MSGALRRKRASKDNGEKRSSSSKHRDSGRSSSHSSTRRGDGEELRGSLSPAVSFYLIILTALVVLSVLSWSLSRPSSSQRKELEPAASRTLTSNSSVYERRLVTSRVSYQSVLSEHARYWENVSHRHFRSSVLAYVTPWNGKGYDLAKTFRAKFTHVSPVWYQLRRDQEGLRLHGRHDVDHQWIKDVRQEGSPLIMPRVVLEGWLVDILVTEEKRAEAIQLIVNEIIEMEFDGIVLEAWTLWRGQRLLEDSKLRKKALEFVKVMGLEFQRMKGTHLYSSGPFQLIFVIPPGNSRDPTSFSSSDMSYLSDVVHGFSLMTYDYSPPQQPGPNAPLPWIQQCLRLLFPSGPKEPATKLDSGQKILMGINFYGNDFTIPQGGGSIVGLQYISILGEHKPQIIWDESSQEHHFHYSKLNRRVYYPSLKSLAARLAEAESWGVGISIWEIGQGLDYFFDLL